MATKKTKTKTKKTTKAKAKKVSTVDPFCHTAGYRLKEFGDSKAGSNLKKCSKGKKIK